MRGLSVIDPECACSCHAHLFGQLVQLFQARVPAEREAPLPTEAAQPDEHQTRAFVKASFDLGEL